LPVMVIYNGFAAAGLKQRAQETGWAKLVAAAGLAAIAYDSHRGGEAADFDSLVAHLRRNASALAIDPSRVAILAWSGHVFRAIGLAMDRRRDYLRAAAFLYGIGPVTDLRTDLPLLFARAGLDNVRLNRGLDSLLARTIGSNAPVTVLAYGGGYHGFDAGNDNDYSRAVIAQTIDFLKMFTGPTIAGAVAQDVPQARAAAALYQENWNVAVTAYRSLVERAPSSADSHLKLAESLMGAGDYEAALASFQRAWDLTDGRRARDIAYPAAIAAARLGSFARAEPWLRILLVRTLTREQLANDSNFQRLRGDPGFQAIIRGL
jgi:dienelactone hydrolase